MSPPHASRCEKHAHDDSDDALDVASANRHGPPPLLASVPRVEVMLSISIGPRLTTVTGEDVPPRLVRHGAVELAVSQAYAANAKAAAVARVVRAAARQVVEHARLAPMAERRGPVVGTEGMARAVITFGALGRGSATVDQLRVATETFADSWVTSTKEGRTAVGVQYMMVGSAVLGAILEQLGVPEIFLEPRSTSADRRGD
jgi:hypothetical protein